MELLQAFYAAAYAAIEATGNSLLPGMLVTALAWAVLRLTPRASAATRYGVWLVTLIAVVCLPLLSSRDSLNERAAPVFVAQSRQPATSSTLSSLEVQTTVAPQPQEPGAVAHARRGVIVLEHDGVLSKRWPLAVFAAWLLTALLLTGRVLLSYRHLARLRSNATPLAAVYQERLQSLLQSCRARRPISLGCSQEITGPVVVGLARPVILFPESLLGRLTEAEFDMVVLHELAHVRRLDDWTNAVQKIIEAVFFFHPLVLWLRGRLDLEREIACDDLVVSVTHEQKRYALCLTKLVEHVGEPRRPSTAVGAGLVKKQIFSRVELLVSSRRRRGFGSRLTTVAGVAVWLLSMSSVLLVYAMFVPTVRLSQSVHAADAMRAAASTTQSLHDAPTAKSSAVALINAPETATIIRREPSASITKDAARRRAMTASPHRNASSPHVAPRHRQGGQSLEDSLRAAAKISSDVEKTDALIEWAAHCPDDDAALSAYLETTATINSANQKERALMALLSRERLSRQILSKVLTIATDDLGSQQSRQKIMNEVMTHLSD